jgi:hypothetical protein
VAAMMRSAASLSVSIMTGIVPRAACSQTWPNGQGAFAAAV